MSTSSECAHCGLPAPAAEGDLPTFCCSGCRTVYSILRDAGLDRFYGLRAELQAPRPSKVEASADSLRHQYAHYDAADFVEALGHRSGEIELTVRGLHCAACVWVIERLPRCLPGVERARVDFGSGRLFLGWDPERIALGDIAAFLHRLGYPTQVASRTASDAGRSERRRELLRLAITGALAGNVMLAAFALYAGELSSMESSFATMFEWVALLLSIPAVTWGAMPFYRGAWAGLKTRVLHMDLPISLGVLAGFGASVIGTLRGTGTVYYDTITILVFLLLLGRWILAWGQRRVLDDAELIQSLVPGTVSRRSRDDQGGWERVYVGRLEVGDVIALTPGERIGADGTVLGGVGHVDSGLLTGESRPVPVGEGSRVFAGAINLEGRLEVKVDAVGSQTRIGKLLDRLASAPDERARIVRVADRLAGWFVGTVISLAIIGGLVWWTLDSSRAFDVVVALLVVSCPCALGLATPMALTIARGRAAKRGILVRDGTALETLARLDTLLLDKTGTLTEGRLRVTAAHVDARWRPHIVALERRSAHPIARAIEIWAQDVGDEVPSPRNLVEEPGSGIEADFDDGHVRIGKMREREGPAEFGSFVRTSLARGHTPVVVEVDARVVGMLALGDRIRSDAPATLETLRSAGLTHLVLCSGDHPDVVRSVADELGLEDARGARTPEDKAADVDEFAPCAMVGDGVNDALALRAADVGVAMSGGAEAALAVADVYLTRHDLGALAELALGARRTMRVIARNLGFSIVYNVVFATLALTGHITPLMAAILMPLSSLTVVFSSLLGPTFSGDVPAEPARTGPSDANLTAAKQCSAPL